jgi:uncharacterized membrane protein YphA (DoxX/SURF4 family)
MTPSEPLVAAVQATVGLVLLGAGGAKLADLSGFAVTLGRLGLPQRWGEPAARGVAAAEVSLGALSLANVAPRIVSVVVFAFTLGFVAVTAYAARWRPQLRCRCFGALAETRFGPVSVLRSVLLAAAGGLVVAGVTPGRGVVYGVTATVLLLAVAAVFAAGCAAAANAVDLVRKGAQSR